MATTTALQRPLFLHGGRAVFVDLRDRRLAGLFAAVWRRVPRQNRCTLLSRLGSGSIVLVTDWALYLPPGRGVELGTVQFISDGIILIWVDAAKQADRSAADVRHTFAHELAHLWCRHQRPQLNGRTASDIAKLSDLGVSLWGRFARRWADIRTAPSVNDMTTVGFPREGGVISKTWRRREAQAIRRATRWGFPVPPIGQQLRQVRQP